MTHAALSAIQGNPVLFLGQGKKRSAVYLGWPEPGSVERDAPVRKAKELYDLYEAYHDSLFPEFETGKLYSAFDFTSDVPVSVRRDQMKRLAVRFGEDPDAVAQGIFGNPDSANARPGSLDIRARWHYDNVEDEGKPKLMPKKPFDAEGRPLPWKPMRHSLGLRKPLSRLARAWQAAHKSLMKQKQVTPWLPALRMIEILVTRLANTGTIERWFKQVSLLELKARARQMHPRLLHSILKVSVQDLWGLRPASEFRARSLLVKDGCQ